MSFQRQFWLTNICAYYMVFFFFAFLVIFYWIYGRYCNFYLLCDICTYIYIYIFYILHIFVYIHINMCVYKIYITYNVLYLYSQIYFNYINYIHILPFCVTYITQKDKNHNICHLSYIYFFQLAWTFFWNVLIRNSLIILSLALTFVGRTKGGMVLVTKTTSKHILLMQEMARTEKIMSQEGLKLNCLHHREEYQFHNKKRSQLPAMIFTIVVNRSFMFPTISMDSTPLAYF